VRLALIVPLAAAGPDLAPALQRLAPLRARGHKVVVADTARVPGTDWSALADRVLPAPRGWALACNAALRTPEADGADALLFLPPECELPADADRAVLRALAGRPAHWGCFRARRAGRAGPLRRAAEWLSHAATCITGLAGREQALFATRPALAALGGFDPDAADATRDLARRALALGRPVVLHNAVLEHRAG
jgi:hypothetical protein